MTCYYLHSRTASFSKGWIPSPNADPISNNLNICVSLGRSHINLLPHSLLDILLIGLITNLGVGVSVKMTLNSFGFSLLLRQRIKDQEINLGLNGRAERLGDRDAPPSGVGDSTLAVFSALYTHLLRESNAF